MPELKTVLLNGKWKYITDKDIKLTFKKAVQLYNSNKIDGRMNVPSNWQKGTLNNFNGAVWYFQEFKGSGQTYSLNILEFSGVDYFAEVWLNGYYIGKHEGYFQKFFFDVSKFLSDGNNLLAVKVTSPKEKPGTVWPFKKKLIKGIFNHHDCRPGGWSYKYGQDQNTGGIWNDVKIISSNLIYTTGIKVTPKLNKDYSKAKVLISFNYLMNSTKSVIDEISLSITTPSNKKLSGKYKVCYLKNSSSLYISIVISKPELWWTWDTGKQNLYSLSLNSSYISIEQKFGIREVKLDDSEIFYLNGKKLFLRGTNVIPEQFLSTLTERRIINQVKLIKDANINVIRMHAHVNRKEYYDVCDREGILVWQDFALQWTYSDSAEFALNAKNQIKDMAELHFNHPSIAFWCCHNEPGSQKNTLDITLYKAVQSIDNSRIIRFASNFEEHPYDGWYWGDKEHFSACPMGPIVTEFGAQALPELRSIKKFLSPGEINKPNWGKWKYHNFQYEQTFHIAGVKYSGDIKKFINNSQSYQAQLITTAIDFYRREKFIKTNALFQFMFIDCWPSISWSVVDYYGRRKQGYYALKRAFQPLYVSVKVMRRKYFPGQKLGVSLWVINDLYKDYINCTIEFILKLKPFTSMPVPEICENSVSYYPWERNELYLPKRIPVGKHRVLVLLKNKMKKVISVNEFFIEIDKKPGMNNE